MKTALDRMVERGIGRLPVVDRANPKKLVGIISRSDILRAYEIAVSKPKLLE